MPNPLNKKLLDEIEKAKVKQQIQRLILTIAVVILAAFGYWSWAWLVLALAAFGAAVDIGMALVIGQVNQAAVTVGNKNPLYGDK